MGCCLSSRQHEDDWREEVETLINKLFPPDERDKKILEYLSRYVEAQPGSKEEVIASLAVVILLDK